MYHKLFSESTAKSPVKEFGIGATILEYVISSTYCDKSKNVILLPIKSFTMIFEPRIVSFWVMSHLQKQDTIQLHIFHQLYQNAK